MSSSIITTIKIWLYSIVQTLKELVEQSSKWELILMDNASCHRNQEVKDYITNKKNDLIHILAYHFQNPIEKLFNQVKYDEL